MSESKLQAANKALSTFSNSRIERRKNGWFVCWENHSQGKMSRRWQCRSGQDFYPVWYRVWAHGGTASTALSQLIRWLQGKPVLPISCWRYWASERVKLLPATVANDLLQAGYPEHASCVLCGIEIQGSFDWWNLDGVSGPCCYYTNGCRQKGKL